MGKSVKEEMGLIQLQFMWFSTDRSLYKYVNDTGHESYKAHSKWKKVKNQMKHGNYFAVLTETKDAPGSTSGYSYNIIGVLATFNDLGEAQYASHFNRTTLNEHDDNWSKLQATVAVGDAIQNWFGEGNTDFNVNTHLLLQLIGEGGLKEAKKLAKDFQ